MKRRAFQEYLEKRLDEDEIIKIKEQALGEKKTLQALQQNNAHSIEKYDERKSIVEPLVEIPAEEL